ncbi:MAG: acyl-CoA dehydrogenase [Acidimicrobiales bacterium]
MRDYRPPMAAIDLALAVVGLQETLELPPFAHLSADDVEGVLSGFGRFAAEVIAPTDRVGDAEGARLDPATGLVTVPASIREVYQRWVLDGWSGLAADVDHGGGGFPTLVGLAAEEMFASANMALSLNPMLTQGSIHLLARWGSEQQRATYLPKLVTGEWTGTMNLTEPDAGSDVGAVRTRAVPRDDGRWEISGTKIFITWGEHDAADNIVHLVLARTPGAPDGTKGISLFVVPRNHVEDDGRVGPRNTVRCTGLEHKLGIHASPTCVLDFDGAVGELVGPENGGMAAMFTMMNASRLCVGLEGLAVSERAYQQALAYARERRQGRVASTPPGEMAPIIEHPDVRRMLLLMASGIDAMRLLLYSTAAATDAARHHPDASVRASAQARVDLLTPLAKAWPTDEGVRLSSLAVQVHGGAGFIEETGIAQRYRDSRIAPIYEGTNGIQAIDLVSRKVRRDHGAAMHVLLAELAADVAALDTDGAVAHPASLADAALSALRKATDWLVDTGSDDDALAAATPYLDLGALAVCGGLLARQVRWARTYRTATEADAIAGRFAFFATERLASAPALVEAITAGAARLSAAHLG